MQNLKGKRGSITIFVLISCLLFIGCVVCVHIYMQSKQVAVDREYRQIKINYEKNTNSLDDIYTESAPFYFYAESEENTITFKRTAAATDSQDKILTTETTFNIVVKNNNGTNYNVFPVDYEISIITNNDKFTFVEGDKLTKTIDGGSKIDSTINLNLKIKDLTNPKKTVRIRIASVGEHEKSVELQFNVKQNGAIQTIEDLVDLSSSVKEATKTDTKRYKLTRDLDFKDPNSYDNANRSDYGDVNEDGIKEEKLIDEMTKAYSDTNAPGAGFLPIGSNDSSNHNFGGTFNGGNYKISNLRIYKSKQKNIGLFGFVKNAKIENLTIENGDVYNINQTAGMLIGKAQGSTITNITIEGGTVRAEDTKNTSEDSNAGGIVGYVELGSTIENCINKATVTTKFAGDSTTYSGPAGGISAWMSSSTISNCSNYGTITGQKYVGGISGFASMQDSLKPNGGGTVKECHNYGKVTTNITKSSDTGPGCYIGGICGYNKANGQVKSCVNESSASVSGINHIGGIVGGNYGTMTLNKSMSSNISSTVSKTHVGRQYGSISSTGKCDKAQGAQ